MSSLRTDLGFWKWQFQAARRKRLAAVEDATRARRAAKDAFSLQAEVRRLRELLADAGVESRRGSVVGLRREVARLRKALGRSRRDGAAKARLSQENAQLRRTVGRQETEIAKLRATRAVHSKALYGRRSEMRERPGSGRPRGQVRGAPRPRPHAAAPGLEERVEEHDPPEEARTCGGCGKPYAAVGAERSALVEIEVKAHRRVNPPGTLAADMRLRLVAGGGVGAAGCRGCSPTRPAEPASGRGCSTSATRACVRRGASPDGCPTRACRSPQGTLADSVPRFVPLFEPLGAAILAHQSAAALRHADETTWRVQALRAQGRSARAWLWASVGDDAAYFHIDPSRSAEAGADPARGTPVRHGARLRPLQRLQEAGAPARRHGGPAVLLVPISAATSSSAPPGRPTSPAGARRGSNGSRRFYRLNEARLACHDAGIDRQSAAYGAAQEALEAALDDVFARAGRELAGLPEDAREGRALRSLANHREGLSVFVERPRTPMDNNLGRAAAARTGDRPAPVVRLRLRSRREARGAHALGGRHPEPERHRRPALARRVAGGVRRERRPEPPDDLGPWLPLVDGRRAPPPNWRAPG